MFSGTWEFKPKVFKFNKDDKTADLLPSKCSYLEHSIGELKGQIADWRGSITGKNEGFHVVEFSDRFECHIDVWGPAKTFWRHLTDDSPGTLGAIFGVAAHIIGGIATYYFFKDSDKNEEESS